MSVFEAMMLVCFGFSWPMAIYKTLTAKSHGGKSTAFSALILLGYLAGMAHKVVNDFNWVFYLYLINTLMVGFDLVMTMIYQHREKEK
ncbi:MAG: hypothetical protein MJ033_06315 [Victivallaceae bacterium]|nr:hypothetical protein [Victivallaceae bacterium]